MVQVHVGPQLTYLAKRPETAVDQPKRRDTRSYCTSRHLLLSVPVLISLVQHRCNR